MKNRNSPLVSIIINNHRGTENLQRCLSSLVKSDYPRIEIVVVDCLTEGIEGWIRERFPETKVIHFNHDVGSPAQFNAGLVATNRKSKYIVFMDNDVETDEEWLRPLVDAMECNPTVGAAQPKMLKMHAKGEVDSVGCFLDPIGYPHRHSFVLKKNNTEFNEASEIFYAETATMMMLRDILKMIPDPKQPFDSDYFIHWHDIDLSWRIWLAGYKVVVVPKSIVYHKRGISGGLLRLSRRHMFFNTRNKMMTLIKNYSLTSLVKYLPVLMAFEVVRGIALLNYRPDHSRGAIAGHIWVLRNLRTVWRKRLEVQRLVRKVPDSTVIDHFIPLNPPRLYQEFHSHYNFACAE